jgi:hypothetical protein
MATPIAPPVARRQPIKPVTRPISSSRAPSCATKTHCTFETPTIRQPVAMNAVDRAAACSVSVAFNATNKVARVIDPMN